MSNTDNTNRITTGKAKIGGCLVCSPTVSIGFKKFKGHWANEKGEKIDSICWGSKVYFYVECYANTERGVKVQIAIKGKNKKAIIKDNFTVLPPPAPLLPEMPFDIDLKRKSEYAELKDETDLELCCTVLEENCFCGNPGEVVAAVRVIRNSTFDNMYSAQINEVYINVIAPKSRNQAGPLIIFDANGVLFKTHSLCRGANMNRLKANGNGDTPTGRTITSYEDKRHNGKPSYGNFGLIFLTGESGEFLTATMNGRAGIAIHSGHTVGYGNVMPIEDKGMLMSTFGCIRVYNTEMKKLGELYTSLKKQGKTIYCYIEDYIGDITDVYNEYDFNVDIKDIKRRNRSNTQ